MTNVQLIPNSHIVYRWYLVSVFANVQLISIMCFGFSVMTNLQLIPIMCIEVSIMTNVQLIPIMCIGVSIKTNVQLILIIHMYKSFCIDKFATYCPYVFPYCVLEFL